MAKNKSNTYENVVKPIVVLVVICLITSTLLVDGADTSMDVGNTHFFFRCAAENEYGSGKSLYTGKANSPDADLTVSYTLDILPNQGKAVYGTGQAAWTFPDLEVIAPNGLRTAILTFFEPGHSTKNDIVVRGGNPYGIEISYDANDYVIFKSASGDLIPQEDWQAFFREYISFVTFDPKDANVDDISWYIAEEDETEKFCLMLFDGTTNGWVGAGDKYGPRVLSIIGLAILTISTVGFATLTSTTDVVWLTILYTIRMASLSY